MNLLASHQDQVHALPAGARLLAGNDFCPVAAFALDQRVWCVQPHPEFDPDYSAFLLDSRRHLLGEEGWQSRRDGLHKGHDGLRIAKEMLAFVRG